LSDSANLILVPGDEMKSTTIKLTWQIAICAVIFAAILYAPPQRAFADQIPSGWEASNMKPIGYSDLGGHEAFKMAIKHVGDRWYLYMGHFVAQGWSIVDVTDPTNPQVVKFIPGPPNTAMGQVDLHGNLMITALQDRKGYGGDPNKQVNEGVLIWDISNRWAPSRSPGGRRAQPARIATATPAASTPTCPRACQAIRDKSW